jgi:hypothetical protein
MTKGSDVSDILATLDKILTTPPEITLASADEGLEEVKMITQAIREHQEAILRLGKRRKKVVLALRYQFGGRDATQRVTYKAIAEAMGTTDQSVYKILFPPQTSKKKATEQLEA